MLSRRFGEAALTEDGAVNKAWLLAAMRDSEKTRREVMDLIHPLVKGRLEAFFQAHAHRRAAFAETPLLLEAGWHKGGDVDVVVGVGCSVAARRGRLAGRGWSEDLMDRMDGWQWDEAKKLGQCRYVVDNSGEPADLAAGADAVLAALAGERRAEAMSRFQALLSAGYAARPGELPPEQTGPPGEPA
jgi:23S rRNA pseudouridine1911/1915/1917 synthase